MSIALVVLLAVAARAAWSLHELWRVLPSSNLAFGLTGAPSCGAPRDEPFERPCELP
jgi:hypothetical protein